MQTEIKEGIYQNMKTLIYITVIALALTPSLHARGGGGGGGHGGGGHSGGHGGARRPGGGGGHHGGGGGGGHHGGGARGHSGHGHWNNHSNHYGHGHWGNNNWNGRGYNSWHGPYYYNPWGWWAGGLFLVGLTFYTSTQFQNTHTWVVSDPNTFNSWASKDDLTIAQLDNDPDGYTALICSGNSCVKARPAPQ